MNHTVLSALKHMSSTKAQRAVCISDEEWIRALLVFAMQRVLHNEQVWKKKTLQDIEKEACQLDLFAPTVSSGLFVETEQFGEKEYALFQSIGTLPLVWAASKSTVKDDDLYSIPKPKPWERIREAQEAVRFLLHLCQTPVVEKGVLLLAQTLISSPITFSSEMEKYQTFVLCGEICENDVSTLIETEESTSLWGLFDALVTRKKQPFFEELVRLEKESHPLQIIRFLRTQFEQLLRLSEGEGQSKFKTQERQVSALREFSFKEKSKWLHRLLVHDIGLRDGTVDEKLSLVAFFLPFFGRTT